MTPLIRFKEVSLKREDHNITGSAKDRAIELQVENLLKQNYKEAVISSTGNAAISAAYYCQKAGVKLTVFISPHTSPDKLKLIQNPIISLKPISDAFKYSKANKAYNLRQSLDPVALDGYSQIGKELTIQNTDITSIFIPVGSGTTLLGISKTLNPKVKIFAIQPASNPTIASNFDKDFTAESTSITDALTIKSLPLKNRLLQVIKSTSGSGIVVQDNDVMEAIATFKDNDISTSPEGALAYAGFLKASKIFDVGINPVILLTGANRI